MNANHLTFLCMSFRGSERVSTDFGVRLDAIACREPAFDELVALLLEGRQSEPIIQALIGSNSTAVFHSQFCRLFSKFNALKLPQGLVLNLEIDGVIGNFDITAASVHYSADSDIDGVEGEDLVLVFFLRPTNAPSTHTIKDRFSNQQAMYDSISGWSWGWPRLKTPFSERFRPGIYLVSGEALVSDPAQGLAQASATAYFFYCWLICQRIERNLLTISANGDWDEEFRKVLLIKKQLVTARKSALLKNRAFPDSLLLRHILKCLEVFRLEDQLAYLTEQSEETSKALEMQNGYVTSARIRSIETIVFVSTILGLAIAINALPMKPFYDDQTINALSRPIFWWVFVIIIGSGLILATVISQWRRTRRIVRWIRRYLATLKKS